jgi:hypothetical protein
MAALYGHHWRNETRPRILARAKNTCEKCGRFEYNGTRLDVAHLVIPPGQPGHDDDDNLAALCRLCHRRHDYADWARRCHETRSIRKDAARPLLREVA